MKVSRLLEGIAHIEDLQIDEFVQLLRNMTSLTAQEKLDGANLWVGLDEGGHLFTSREGKRTGAERRYSPEDWPKISAFNQFRAAHAALLNKKQEIHRVLQAGDTVEAEVLFGRQPNSVTYGAGGKSYVAFVRGVSGTSNKKADDLCSALANQQADVKVEIVDSADGRELSAKSVNVLFQFIAPQRLDMNKLHQESGVEALLKKLESFLGKASTISSMTNLKLATSAATGIPADQKNEFKQAKTALLAQLQSEFKLPIKNALLSKTRKKSSLAADDITPNEDTGIEGIVLRDPSTEKQVKIVDRDIFTAINTFNQSVRGDIQSALNTTDPAAALHTRGGLLGQLRIRIAEVLGNRELAKASNVRKQLEPIKGKTPEEAIKNLANSLKIEDFIGVKKKILAITAETYQELDQKLEEFKANKDNYTLELKNGKTIGLSDETVKKTLLTFAEARRNLTQLFDKLKGAKTLASMLGVMYATSARGVHADQLAESVLTEKQRHAEISVNDFHRKDTFHLVNSYLATVFMTMLIYHTNDTIGMRFLRDRKNWQLRKHSDDMSPFNHWGYVIWKTAKSDLEKNVMKAAKAELIRVTKKIPAPCSKYLHMDFSLGKPVLNWSDHKKTLTRLIDLSGVRSERVNTLLDLSVSFLELELTEQKSAIKKIAAFAHQFVPRSRLYSRLKAILGNLGDEKDMVAERLLKRVIAIAEEDPGTVSGFEVGAGTTAGSIATLPTRLGQRATELRRRNTTKRFIALTRKHKDPRNYKDIT